LFCQRAAYQDTSNRAGNQKTSAINFWPRASGGLCVLFLLGVWFERPDSGFLFYQHVTTNFM
jgi:hypothetical protein